VARAYRVPPHEIRAWSFRDFAFCFQVLVEGTLRRRESAGIVFKDKKADKTATVLGMLYEVS